GFTASRTRAPHTASTEVAPPQRPRARHATFRDRRPRLSWGGRAAAPRSCDSAGRRPPFMTRRRYPPSQQAARKRDNTKTGIPAPPGAGHDFGPTVRGAGAVLASAVSRYTEANRCVRLPWPG